MSGLSVVCMASGPSLCAEDAELVRQWQGAGRAVYVVNTTYRMAPWADTLYAHDPAWWAAHHAELEAVFHGERVSARAGARKYGARILPITFQSLGNSGADAAMLALERGAQRVILLGYDCQRIGGATHWHGDHPVGLGNAGSIEKWPRKFAALSRRAGGRIVNASRETALTCFPRAALEDLL